MKKSERLRDQFPMIGALGESHKFLGQEDSATADFATRIKSIWPFVVKKALTFSATLKPREAVHYDTDDVLSEVWLKLAENDNKWTPDRGKYITFAGIIIDHHLEAIRDKANTVHAPRNSKNRIEQYREEDEKGDLNGRKSKTHNDIMRAKSGAAEIDLASPATIDHRMDDSIDRRERCEAASMAVMLAIRKLTPWESAIVARMAGLSGEVEASPKLIAWALSCEVSEVRKTHKRALEKMRSHLVEAGHSEL